LERLPTRKTIIINGHRHRLSVDAPWNPIRVMLARGKDDLVLRAKLEAIGDEVDGFGGSTNEHDLRRRCPNERGHFTARIVEESRRLFAERMHAAMYVRRRVLVIANNGVDHRARFWCGRCVVKKDDGSTSKLSCQEWDLRADLRGHIVDLVIGGGVSQFTH